VGLAPEIEAFPEAWAALIRQPGDFLTLGRRRGRPGQRRGGGRPASSLEIQKDRILAVSPAG
jgi:hypothetical protein